MVSVGVKQNEVWLNRFEHFDTALYGLIMSPNSSNTASIISTNIPLFRKLLFDGCSTLAITNNTNMLPVDGKGIIIKNNFL